MSRVLIKSPFFGLCNWLVHPILYLTDKKSNQVGCLLLFHAWIILGSDMLKSCCSLLTVKIDQRNVTFCQIHKNYFAYTLHILWGMVKNSWPNQDVLKKKNLICGHLVKFWEVNLAKNFLHPLILCIVKHFDLKKYFIQQKYYIFHVH